MLLTTNWPTAGEREQVLAAMPWVPDFVRLWRFASAAFDHFNINGVDAALPYGHGRGAVVALHEGIETMLDSTHDLADSRALNLLLDRTEVPRPMLLAPLLATGQVSETPLSLCLRLARASLETSAIRVASVADHLANAHVRLAWELNAATGAETARCAFDLGRQEPDKWLSAGFLADRLGSLTVDASARLPYFVCNESFAAFQATPASKRVRQFRDRVVHRERPAYRELPSLGRATRWRNGGIALSYEPDRDTPTFEQLHEQIGAALQALLPWAQSLWETTVRWLSTMGVELDQRDEGGVTVQVQIGSKPTREERDPAPYLLRFAPFAPAGSAPTGGPSRE